MDGRGRSRSREAFDERVRISLLEDDLDRIDRAVDRMEGNLRKLTQAVLAAALSLTVASVLLAVNLAVS